MILFCINGEASLAQPRRAAERCRGPDGRAAPAPAPQKLRHPRTAAPLRMPPAFPGRGEEEEEGTEGSFPGAGGGGRGRLCRCGGSAQSSQESRPTGRAALAPRRARQGRGLICGAASRTHAAPGVSQLPPGPLRAPLFFPPLFSFGGRGQFWSRGLFGLFV